MIYFLAGGLRGRFDCIVPVLPIFGVGLYRQVVSLLTDGLRGRFDCIKYPQYLEWVFIDRWSLLQVVYWAGLTVWYTQYLGWVFIDRWPLLQVVYPVPGVRNSNPNSKLLLKVCVCMEGWGFIQVPAGHWPSGKYKSQCSANKGKQCLHPYMGADSEIRLVRKISNNSLPRWS